MGLLVGGRLGKREVDGVQFAEYIKYINKVESLTAHNVAPARTRRACFSAIIEVTFRDHLILNFVDI